jgi:hypothetical protein
MSRDLHFMGPLLCLLGDISQKGEAIVKSRARLNPTQQMKTKGDDPIRSANRQPLYERFTSVKRKRSSRPSSSWFQQVPSGKKLESRSM